MLFTGTFEMKDNDEILHCHLMELMNCGNRVFPMVNGLFLSGFLVSFSH